MRIGVFLLLEGFEQESEEDVGGKENEGEHDCAAHASPGGHALILLFLGFALGGGFALGRIGVVSAAQSRVAVGCGCLFHAWLVGRGSGGMVLWWRLGVKVDALLLTLGRRCAGLVFTAGGDACLGNGLMGL